MKTIVYCTLNGENFNPKDLLETDLFKIGDSDYHLHLVGDKSNRTGKLFTTAHICLRPKNESFEEFVTKLYSVKHLIIDSQADRRTLYITFLYENQCNWTFEPDLLRMLTELDIALAVSCDQVLNS